MDILEAACVVAVLRRCSRRFAPFLFDPTNNDDPAIHNILTANLNVLFLAVTVSSTLQ